MTEPTARDASTAAETGLPSGTQAAAAQPNVWPPAVRAWLAEEAELIGQGRLDAACKSRLYAVPEGPIRAVALMLHGFTAGPWQYDEVGPTLAKDGVLGLAVRLVGHGATRSRATGIGEDGSDLPKAAQMHRFALWAERALDAARALADQYQVPLHLLGASAGGAMALDVLRHERARIARVVLIAPLLRPKSRLLGAFVGAFAALPFGHWLADRWNVGWRRGPPRADGWQRPGHQDFALGNVAALFRYARAVAPRAGQPLAAPLQIIATDIDDKVSVAACRALARSEGERHALYVFAKAAKVPHAMMTAWENPDPASRAQIIDIIRRYIVGGEATRHL